MGDSAEFEKLTMLEGRLAAALDRIAVGIGELHATPRETDDPGITSAAFEDASMRAEAAEAQVATLNDRITALETRLDETQAALADAEAQLQQPAGAEDAAPSEDQAAALAAMTEERDALMQQAQALEAAREADRDDLSRQLGERDAELARLEASVQAAEAEKSALRDSLDALRADAENQAAQSTAPPVSGTTSAIPDEDVEDLQEELEFARARVRRLRQQRNEARAELDAARHLMDDATAPSDEIDSRLAALRAEVAVLRASNEDLIEQISRLREDTKGSGTVASEALIDEVQALRAARASEAAELERIMADLAPALSEGEQHG